MPDQDFSQRTVAQKLGINPGDEITILNAPENYLKLLGTLDKNLTIVTNLSREAKFIHYFASSKFQLEKDFLKLKNNLDKDGVLWVSNKKGLADFNQNDVQRVGLENGLVDVKVASLNDEWSAMKFVYRIKDR